jgi:predicted NBD/HSP70 family sugar kinase
MASRTVYVAISVGGTKLAWGFLAGDRLVYESGKLAWQELMGDAADSSPSRVLEMIVSKTRELLASQGMEPSGVGLAWPGPGDYERGIVSATFLPGFDAFPLKTALGEELWQVFGRPVPVTLMLDAVADLLGEVRSPDGGLRGHSDGMILNLATGVAAGLLADGHIVTSDLPRGITAGLGQLGRHLIRRPDGTWDHRPTRDGSVAPHDRAAGELRLTDYLGGPALARRIRRELREDAGTAQETNGRDIQEERRLLQSLSERARAGDPGASSFVQQTARDIGAALRVFLDAYPRFGNRIVLVGGVGENLGLPTEGQPDLFLWQIQETRAARPEQQTVRSRLGVAREFLAFV